jgi:type IV pilus assembly protein PilY1
MDYRHSPVSPSFHSTLRVMQAWLLSMTALAWSSAQAAPLDLAQAPLFLGTSVDAKVFFQVDDSGSMDWETLVPEFYYYNNYWTNTSAEVINHGRWESAASTGGSSSFRGQRSYGYMFADSDRLYQTTTEWGANAETYSESLVRDWRARSSDFNLIYYDPTQTYRPWPGMPDASFTAARSNPQSGSTGYSVTRNLTNFVFEVWIDDHGFKSSYPKGPKDVTDGANGVVDLWDSHVRYTVGSSTLTAVAHSVPAATTIIALNRDCTLARAQASVPYKDCYGTSLSTTTYNSTALNPWGRTLAEEKQNIANWYSYYRKRSFVAKAAIGAVVTEANNFRYGLSLINNEDKILVPMPAADTIDYTSHNNNLLSKLYSYKWDALGTPLRRGLQSVGRYYDNVIKGYTDPIISECQQNFSILLTDGYWSGSDPDGIGDVDKDGRSKTLADVAMHYYNLDLSPLPNNVPTSVIDGNNKQHMVTFGVAFGVSGDLVDTDNDGLPNPPLKSSDKWGQDPFSSDATKSEPGKIDDLWHAAFNSKGNYIAAQTPAALVRSLTDALSAIADRVGSSASVATNSGSLNAGSHLFQARFDSGGWSGQLIAFAINPDGTLNPVPSWEAGKRLDMQHYSLGRAILTFNPTIDSPAGGVVEGKGVPFRFPANYKTPDASGLSAAQIKDLLSFAPHSATTTNATQIAANQAYGNALVNYLRGDRSNENIGYNFRRRNSALGDIVDSDPQYVGAPRYRYPDNLEVKPYSAFRTTFEDRQPMVYVGANDGMLHAFAETDGRELLAYIPNKVFSNLPLLSRNDYIHRYFVNEAPTVVDAFLPGHGAEGNWRTVLVGGLGRGGQGIYALDVTDPSSFSEANAAQIVLWEFDDEDDADLGYTYGSPSIAKMHNGKWVAVFGNGYNNSEADGHASTTGRAYLFIVDIETGKLIKKIDTGVGATGTPNGLASPALIDTNGDFVVDYIYAGDLRGNLWKFDVTSANPNQWDVAYKKSGNPAPLFTARNGQPITSRPQVTLHPDNREGFMVYFGTGKYLESNDNVPAGSTTQSFYGVWDKNQNTLTAFTIANLLKQSITNQFTMGFDTDDDGVEDKDYVLREVSDYPINYNTHMGWYMDLIPEKVNKVNNSNNFGEKQVSNALVRDGRVIFTTLIPSQNQCDFGGSSFIMALDYRNGGLLEFPPFDLNGDQEFDASDAFVGGSQSDVGIVSTLSIISDTDSEIGFGSGSSGDVESVGLNVGSNALGRQSWRQVR